MEDPVRDVERVVSLLTMTPPNLQQAAIDKYFTPEASFTHPFCRTGSNKYSKYLISRIFRWYKILSPKVSAKVHSVSFDEKKLVLYVGITQVFAIWAIPTHRSEVSLVTVLHLERHYTDPSDPSAVPPKNGEAKGKPKYYISAQNDLYQTDQFLKFVLPWFAIVVPLWQYFASLVCVVCSYIFAPVTWWEENLQEEFRRAERPPRWNDGR